MTLSNRSNIAYIGAAVFLIIFAFMVTSRASTNVRPLKVSYSSEREMHDMRSMIERLGARKEDSLEIADAIYTAAGLTGLDPDFLAALIYTESTFDKRAVSNKKYNGLMQIPYPVFDAHANAIIGARIFNDKMRIARNDVVKALCLYKGWGNLGGKDNPRGREQAEKVLAMYTQIREGGVNGKRSGK